MFELVPTAREPVTMMIRESAAPPATLPRW
jgi:hypothetical protein